MQRTVKTTRSKPTGQQDAQVLIVGGGPVGLGLAIDLGQRGISVSVVERHAKVHHVPKGQNLTQRTGEHFRFWGVSKEIRNAAPIPHAYGSAGLTAYGTLLSGYSYDWFRRAEVRPYYFADNERLPQYATETVFRHRASQLDNVNIHYGWSVTGLQQHDQNVTVEIAERTGPGQRRLSAQYVVGCDGSGSVTRDLASIEQDIEPHDRRMVLLVFNSMELHALLELFSGKSYFSIINPKLNGYWQFLGRVDLKGTWFFHAPVPVGTTVENFDFEKFLHGVVGAEFALNFEHVGFWDLRIATAKTYCKGRVFIAGDAAHSHPPYGGFGINTGLEDARNLAWKLAAQLQGWGGDALLDSYSSERLPVFRSTADDFIARMIGDDREFINQYNPKKDLASFEAAWTARAAGGNSDVTAYAPHYCGSPLVIGSQNGPPSAAGSHSFTARAGQHLAPHELPGKRDLFNEIGADFALISLGGSKTVEQRFEKAASQLNVPLAIITASDPELENTYGAKYILVRPDHFIAWVGNSESVDAFDIIRHVVGGQAS